MKEIKYTDEIDVKLVNHIGGDDTIIGAAKVSTSGDECLRVLEEDPEHSKGLINYLVKNRHGSPFEHGSMTFFVKAPIFVWREWHRHIIGALVSHVMEYDWKKVSVRKPHLLDREINEFTRQGYEFVERGKCESAMGFNYYAMLRKKKS